MTLKVFISYSRHDSEIYDIPKIAKELSQFEEIEEVFYYEGAGYNNIVKYMNDNIGKCDIFLAFCSENALESKYIEMEWQAALWKEKTIIPVFINERDIPPLLAPLLGIDFNVFNIQDNINTLFTTIQKALGKSQPVSLQGGKLAETEGSMTIQEPPPEQTKITPGSLDIKKSTTQISENRKKCEFHKNSGKIYSEKQRYEKAIEEYKKALEICISDLQDAQLRFEIEELIEQSEAQQRKEAEEKARIERENQLKSKYQDLTDEAQQHFDQGQWDSAMTKFKEVIGICQQLNFPDGIKFAESMITKAEESAKKEAEADVLQALERQLNKDFQKVDKVEWNTKMGFSVGNNRVTGIGLYECGVSTLPESIGNLSSLKELYLYENKLSTLPESFWNLKSLQILSLSSNKFTTLPESIGNLKSLKRLDVDNNQLTTLPVSIGNLSSLKELRLYKNQLTTLPESIGNLSSLKELRIYENKLSTLPESFWNLKSLQKLSLISNKFTTLPESIGQLSSLQTLYLHNNQLSALPESIGNLKSLQRLDVDNNQLTTLPESIKILEKRGVTIYK